MIYIKPINQFLNESLKEDTVLYHAGEIKNGILDPNNPIWLSVDYYMAESYLGYSGDFIYSFILDKSANLLDLTNLKTFQEVKSKVYDNYSEKFIKYKNEYWGYEEKEKLRDYNILKNYKNYDEILKRIEEIKTSGTLYDLFYNLNKEEFDEAKIYHPEWKFKLDKYNNEAEKYYYDNIDNLSEEIKLKFKEWFILESLVYNMNYLSHISTNEFGFYFVDYCKENGYDGYLAVSSYADPRITGEEVVVVNTKKLHSMKIVTKNPY